MHIEYCIVVMYIKPTFVAFHVHFSILIYILNTVLQFCTQHLAQSIPIIAVLLIADYSYCLSKSRIILFLRKCPYNLHKAFT
jgi:hypothetical protein